MLTNETLETLYKINFRLMHIYNYSLDELEKMIPFEREIYLSMIKQLEQEQKNNG